MEQSKKCESCGQPLEFSQYAKRKGEGYTSARQSEGLVCRNQTCLQAEKEVE